jgi:hypothetical protein
VPFLVILPRISGGEGLVFMSESQAKKHQGSKWTEEFIQWNVMTEPMEVLAILL